MCNAVLIMLILIMMVHVARAVEGEPRPGIDLTGSILPLEVFEGPTISPLQNRNSFEKSKENQVFVPGRDGQQLWKQTLETFSSDWPIAVTREPDFTSSPPLDGLIESAWLEPPGQSVWPPQRQRIRVRVVPAIGGAWIEAVMQTESLGVAPDVEMAGMWQAEGNNSTGDQNIATRLAAQMAPRSEPVYTLPAIEGEELFTGNSSQLPWASSKYPKLSHAGHNVLQDYKNFYGCENLVCLTAAFGAGALMANTGFDTTMQTAWQTSVTPTGVGTFFSDTKPLGEGKYALPIFGLATATGLLLEGNYAGDIVGEWGSRSLRMFVVGAPPLYILQLATGGSRPLESSAGSKWKSFQDDNGVSGHAFVGAIPFLAAAEMVENPWAKGTLYVCSTFVGFSRMTDNAHYPSQAFLGWYLAWSSAVAVSRTEMHFAGMQVRVVPIPMAGTSGLGIEATW